MWTEQNRHPGDRTRLFAAVAAAVPGGAVLYPGSFVDLAASFVFDSVTYVDSDRRAAQFFADRVGVSELIAEHRGTDAAVTWRFIGADYTTDMGLEDASFDLLISLYAGFVSAACGRYLKAGGHLLVNPSHGDAAMAALDPAFRLAGVVKARRGSYAVDRSDLDQYLIPKSGIPTSQEQLRASGRGIGYTRSPFAYLFRRS